MKFKKIFLRVLAAASIMVMSLCTSVFASTHYSVSSLLKQISSLKAQVSSLQKQVSSQKTTISSLNSQITKYKSSYIMSPLKIGYVFNGVPKSGDYNDGKSNYPSALSYNNIIYAPVNFIAGNLGLAADYTSAEKTFYIGPKPVGVYMVNVIGKPYFISGNSVNTYTSEEKMNMGKEPYYNGYQLAGYYGGTKTGFNLAGKYKNVSGVIGLDDCDNINYTKVQVKADNNVIATYELQAGDLPQNFSWDVTNVKKLEIDKIDYGWDLSTVDIADVKIK